MSHFHNREHDYSSEDSVGNDGDYPSCIGDHWRSPSCEFHDQYLEAMIAENDHHWHDPDWIYHRLYEDEQGGRGGRRPNGNDQIPRGPKPREEECQSHHRGALAGRHVYNNNDNTTNAGPQDEAENIHDDCNTVDDWIAARARGEASVAPEHVSTIAAHHGRGQDHHQAQQRRFQPLAGRRGQQAWEREMPLGYDIGEQLICPHGRLVTVAPQDERLFGHRPEAHPRRARGRARYGRGY